jgi:hypothetical protein
MRDNFQLGPLPQKQHKIGILFLLVNDVRLKIRIGEVLYSLSSIYSICTKV